jgi:antitoxin component YwqK of YwqJK toxin-antitoxin module
MTGRYNNDLREGEWLIFKQDGSQRYKLNYTAGKPDINDLDIYESNYFDSLGRIKVKIADPDKTGEIW